MHPRTSTQRLSIMQIPVPCNLSLWSHPIWKMVSISPAFRQRPKSFHLFSTVTVGTNQEDSATLNAIEATDSPMVEVFLPARPRLPARSEGQSKKAAVSYVTDWSPRSNCCIREQCWGSHYHPSHPRPNPPFRDEGGGTFDAGPNKRLWLWVGANRSHITGARC